MVVFPPCKVNLGLRILRRRPDGYHDLDTCFLQLPWCDILEIVPARELKLNLSGLHLDGDPQDNLCVKAYHLLAKDFDLLPVEIYLHKMLPSGAGLGGGSADAAYTLLVLRDLFQLPVTDAKLIPYAAQLGSDCPLFLHRQPLLGSGRGEVLEPISLPVAGVHFLLVKPEVSVGTREAYAGVTPGESGLSVREILTQPMDTWRGLLNNDFEPSVFQRYPGIGDIKETLYKNGAIYASMSGSGSTVFGMFATTPPNDLFPGLTTWTGQAS